MRFCTARSSQARNSACCAEALRPVRLGQSMLATLATHIARSWRLGVAGSVAQAARAVAVAVCAVRGVVTAAVAAVVGVKAKVRARARAVAAMRPRAASRRLRPARGVVTEKKFQTNPPKAQ